MTSSEKGIFIIDLLTNSTPKFKYVLNKFFEKHKYSYYRVFPDGAMATQKIASLYVIVDYPSDTYPWLILDFICD